MTAGWAAGAPSAPLRVLEGHVPEAVARLQPVASLDASRRLNLAIGLPLRNQGALTALLGQLYDPASPVYHHYLLPGQFAEKFGATESDYQAVIAFAQTNGLAVTRKHGNRLLLDVTGSTAQIEKAFHVKLRLYQHPTEARTFYAPDGEPSVDRALAILHVSGLDDYAPPRPANLDPSGGQGSPESPAQPMPQVGSGPGGSLLGNDFRAAYLPGVSLNGTGQQVGLVEFDGYETNDIAAYESLAGLPNVTLTNVLLDGFNGSAGPNAGEVSLDIEMVISMAPAISQVITYEAGGSAASVYNVLNTMATDNLAKQLSSSWTFSVDQTISQVFQQFAAQGQSYFNAVGDTDAYAVGVAAPTDNPFVTVVGGTALTTSAAGGAWVSETVWNRDNGVGSSGGFSSTYPIPTWQQAVSMSNNMGSPTMRNTPDVACVAAGVWIIYGGGSTRAASGTSCAAPLWAGLTALVNQQALGYGLPTVGFLNPALYQIGLSSNYTRAFHDVITGNNTNNTSPNRFFAATGYDLCTGWGTPNGQPLIDALAPRPDSLQVLPAAGFEASGPAGGAFSLNAENIELTNISPAALGWSLGATPAWLGASPSSGSLGPGTATNIALNLSPLAATLPPGSYSASVAITNAVSGAVHVLAFTLNVSDPLVISPSAGFSAGGPAGGPFNITAVNFLLTNGGGQALSWAVAGPPWLSVSPNAGVLEAGQESATVQVNLNSVAGNLVSGAYSGTLVFSNLTAGTAQSQGASLTVGESAVQNGGFETGDFSGWTLSGNTSSVVVTTNSLCAHSGGYGVQLGPPFSPGYLSQTMPTFPGRMYLISLWMDSPDGKTPNQFTISWDGQSLFRQINLPALGWTNLQFIAQATQYQTVLEFGFLDVPTFLGLDDVSATLVTPPAFQSVTQSGSGIIFNWNAVPGWAYQLQRNNDLNSGAWTNLGAVITAASSTQALTNAMTNGQQFYRLLQIGQP